MKKLLTILTFSLIFSSLTYGQSLKDRFLFSLGWGVHYTVAPTTVTTYMDQYDLITYYAAENWTGFSFYDLIFDLRFNIIEPSKDMAIALKLSPAVGTDFGKIGYGSLQLPILIGLESGAGSTYSASAEKGFFINAGITYMINPLIEVKEDAESSVVNNKGSLKKSWISPTIALGYRYWNSHNRLSEIGLQYRAGPKGDDIPLLPTKGGITSSTSAMYIGISFKRFLNY
jgi:hypothetical protein